MCFWCLINSISTHVLNRKSNRTCDFISADASFCYYIDNITLPFDDAITHCNKEYNGTIPSHFSDDDYSFLNDDTHGLLFWLGVKGTLTLDPKLRISLINQWIDGQTYNKSRWDFEQIDLSIYWRDQPYCAEVSSHESDDIIWIPKDCTENSRKVVCQVDNEYEDDVTTTPPVELITTQTNDTTPTTYLTTTDEEIAQIISSIINTTMSPHSVTIEEDIRDNNVRTDRKEDNRLLAAVVLLLMIVGMRVNQVILENLDVILIIFYSFCLLMILISLTTLIVVLKSRRTKRKFEPHNGMYLLYVHTDENSLEPAFPENTNQNPFIIKINQRSERQTRGDLLF